MSTLRKQLVTLHAEYVSAAYPGDLATETLPKPLPWRRIAWLSSGFTIGSLAAAAAVVLMVGHLNLTPPAAPEKVTGRVVQVADEHLTKLGLPALPDLSKLAHAVGLDDVDRFLPERMEQLKKMIAPAKPADATDESHRA